MEHLIKWLKENGYYEEYLIAIKLPCNAFNLLTSAEADRYTQDILNNSIAWIDTLSATGIDWCPRHRAFQQYSYNHDVRGKYFNKEVHDLIKGSSYTRMLKFARSQCGNAK